MKRAKNRWVLLLLMLAGIVLGSFIATLAQGVPGFSWLAFGESFGLSSPLVLDLGIMVITFALTIHITIASIANIILSAIDTPAAMEQTISFSSHASIRSPTLSQFSIIIIASPP